MAKLINSLRDEALEISITGRNLKNAVVLLCISLISISAAVNKIVIHQLFSVN